MAGSGGSALLTSAQLMEILLALFQSKILDVFGRFLCQYLKHYVFKDQWTSKKPSPKVTLCAHLRWLQHCWTSMLFLFPLPFMVLLSLYFPPTFQTAPSQYPLHIPLGLSFCVGVSLGSILCLLIILLSWTIPKVLSCVKSLCLAQANLMDPSPTFPVHLVIRFALAYGSFYFLHN